MRLGFRCWRESDLPLALGLWGDPQVMKFIDARLTLSGREVKELLEKHIKFQHEAGIQYWPIFLLSSGEHVGCCGLRPCGADPGTREIGVHLRRKFWRQGLAEEASRTVIAYAFGRLGLNALFAGHHPENTVSPVLLIRLGFRYTHHEPYGPSGLLHPSYLLENSLR